MNNTYCISKYRRITNVLSLVYVTLGTSCGLITCYPGVVNLMVDTLPSFIAAGIVFCWLRCETLEKCALILLFIAQSAFVWWLTDWDGIRWVLSSSSYSEAIFRAEHFEEGGLMDCLLQVIQAITSILNFVIIIWILIVRLCFRHSNSKALTVNP